MTTPVNPTDAKDVALYFIEQTAQEKKPHIISRTIKQTKNIMQRGYSKEQVIEVIDYLSFHGVQMYSIGYVDASIDDVLVKIEAHRLKVKGKTAHEELERELAKKREAVSTDAERARRNKEKARKQQSSVQSRKRKKFNFDMFKE